jgi:hypothetical protein
MTNWVGLQKVTDALSIITGIQFDAIGNLQRMVYQDAIMNCTSPFELVSNNINPYGEWHGFNGKPWCAIFVSYVAYEAGILNTVVPRFSLVTDGVKWYKD